MDGSTQISPVIAIGALIIAISALITMRENRKIREMIKERADRASQSASDDAEPPQNV